MKLTNKEKQLVREYAKKLIENKIVLNEKQIKNYDQANMASLEICKCFEKIKQNYIGLVDFGKINGSNKTLFKLITKASDMYTELAKSVGLKNNL